jgi:8-oxo-dGTP pyrophosphatase MutT (NUDIX family)
VITQIGSREVFASPWLRLREDDIEYADGSRSTYAVMERRDFVTVLPSENGGLWLVEQYRYPLGRRCWELPQGAWPAGKTGSALELGRAELLEETGLTAARWTQLGRLAASPGLSTQHFDVFLATDLTPGEPEREHSEADMVHRWFPDAQVRAMARRGELFDCHSIAALALWDLHR